MSLIILLKSVSHPLSGILGLSLMLSAGMATSSQEHDPHAHHKHMMKQTGYTSSVNNYVIPDLYLIDTYKNKISLSKTLSEEGPVILNFIFTTCTTICPVLSATFSQVQRELGNEAKNVRMISITIDPEQDTPERLKEYASRFKAGSEWQFLTGSIDDIISTQKSFDAYRGDKMNHIALTFLRSTQDGPWLRLEGFTSAAEVVTEYRHLSK
ncbi:MAG: SCO family protein [Gammaproteobacteria bacterium]